jgi:hypothetical protein
VLKLPFVMNRTAHRIYLALLSLIVLVAFTVIALRGYTYYHTSLEDRFFHPDDAHFKPSGLLGHGMGIIGSLCMILGVSLYMARKRYRAFSRIGILKHWLEFHIFLCTLGPVLVLFHTSFKFGGIVAISFWSMVAVFLSGIAGRFIYIQIPHTIEGRELSLNEIREMKADISNTLGQSLALDEESKRVIMASTVVKKGIYYPNIVKRILSQWNENRQTMKTVKSVLKQNRLSKGQQSEILRLVKNEISLNRRIERLTFMKNLFKYWHVAHLPFALVMLVIMVVHVAVTIVFGYRWIF